MNKQTKRLKKLGLKTKNMGPSTAETKIEHGAGAFYPPDKAIAEKKKNGSRSWRISKVHPANPKNNKV